MVVMPLFFKFFFFQDICRQKLGCGIITAITVPPAAVDAWRCASHVFHSLFDQVLDAQMRYSKYDFTCWLARPNSQKIEICLDAINKGTYCSVYARDYTKGRRMDRVKVLVFGELCELCV